MTLRHRLSLLVAIALIPPLLLTLYHVVRSQIVLDKEARDEALAAARLISAEFSQLIEGSRQLTSNPSPAALLIAVCLLRLSTASCFLPSASCFLPPDFYFRIAAIKIRATSGRENSRGGSSPSASRARTLVPDSVTCSAESCGQVLFDAIASQRRQ